MDLQKWRQNVVCSRSKNNQFVLAVIDDMIRRERFTREEKISDSMKDYWQHVKQCADIRNLTASEELDRRALEEIAALNRTLRRTINERKRNAKDHGRADGAC